MTASPSLTLASASAVRARLIRDAGIVASIDPSTVDEAAIKSRMTALSATPDEIARSLASAKAEEVSGRHRGALVLGADQVLVHDGILFDKPASIGEARDHLGRLSGDSHDLISAASFAMDGETLWTTAGHARLIMRSLSSGFIDDYLERAGDAVLSSVGCYQLEALGAQLFHRVDGDYFCVLGLPLLEVLDFLRRRGVIPT